MRESSDIKRLGEFLRAERRARGIDLEQISADTRISLNMLQAIEDGNVKHLPAPVLVKSFLKSYAQRLGLDPEEVIIRYRNGIEELGGDHREAMEKFHQRLHPPAPRTKIFAFLSVIGLLAALTFIWLSYNQMRKGPVASEDGKAASTPEQRVSGGTPAEQELPALLSGKTESELRPETAPPTPAESAHGLSLDKEKTKIGNAAFSTDNRPRHVRQPSSASAPFVVRAEAIETAWLRILIDENQEREYTLQPGEHLTWSAASSIHLLVGNAGGIRLYFNNEPLKPLGESGQVVRLDLPDPTLVEQNNPRNGQ